MKSMLGVVASTCTPAASEAEFRSDVVAVLVRGNSPSIGEWIM